MSSLLLYEKVNDMILYYIQFDPVASISPQQVLQMVDTSAVHVSLCKVACIQELRSNPTPTDPQITYVCCTELEIDRL